MRKASGPAPPVIHIRYKDNPGGKKLIIGGFMSHMYICAAPNLQHCRTSSVSLRLTGQF
jgi:hypothetical protein